MESNSNKAREQALVRRVVATRLQAHDNDEFSFVELWRVLQKRKWTIVICTLICIALGMMASLVMTPKYEATAVVEVNKANSDMLGLDSLAGLASGGSDSLDQNVTLKTEASVLKSDSLLFHVVEQLDLEKRKEFAIRPGLFDGKRAAAERGLPLEKAPLRRQRIHKVFERNLVVDPVAGTRLIEVKFLSPDPQVASDVVNTLVNDYLEQYFRTRYAATVQASDWLAKQLSDLKNQVDASQEKLNKLQEQAGILGVVLSSNGTGMSSGGKGNISSSSFSAWPAMDKLQDLNRQLTAAESDRILKETVYRLAKSGDPESISSLAGSTLVGAGTPGANSLALVQTLRAQEAQLKAQYAQAATKYGANYPLLVQLRNQLADLDSSIQAELQKVVARAENDYKAAKRNEDMLRASFENQKGETNKLQDVASQYTITLQEVQAGRALYADLLTKLKEGGVLAGLHSTNIVVVDPARTTPAPTRPSYPLNLMLGLGAGLLCGVALAFMRESLDRTIRTPEQVETVTALPSLGIIPRVSAGLDPSQRSLRKQKDLKSDQALNIINSPDSQMAEVFRSLRTSLLLSNVDAPPKVIMVTSSLPGEGKSTISLNVSVALAQQQSRVLLIDSDMRRPTLHSRLNLQPGRGLSDVLASTNGNGPQPTQVNDVPNLFVLTAGARPPYPAELLGSNRMKDCFDSWRNDFDFIVVDTPPVLSVTDAVVLSRNADAVLLVVRSEQTTKEALLRTRDLLLRANALIAGVLVNGVDLDSPDHYYYYGYYGSKYAKGYYNEDQKN